MGVIGLLHRRRAAVVSALLLLALPASGRAQTTTFTYQGRLVENGVNATGLYDFQFTLYDTVTVGTGTAQGSPVLVGAVPVTSGLFTVPLDFGVAVFPGAARFLEIAVKKPADAAFNTLGPRQPLSSEPYAIRSLAATAADGLSASCVNCVTSTQVLTIQGSQITGPIPVPSVPAGSGFYVQNGTTVQASAGFNVDGTGKAGILSAGTQFNLGANRVLAQPGAPGVNVLTVGVNAGLNNGTGTANTFVGINAGQNNASGSSNQFFGFNAGFSTTTGGDNSFFGDAAGVNNVGGGGNAYFGALSGFNSTGSNNSYFGNRAGGSNSTGQSNSLFGSRAGVNMASGTSNTLLGANTIASSGLDHATAIGADAAVTASSIIVLGRPTDTTQVSGVLNVVASQVNFAGSRVLANAGTRNVFVGIDAGTANTGTENTFVGNAAGQANTTGAFNTFVGSRAGQSNTGGGNTFVGALTGGVNTGSGNSFFGQFAGNANTTGSNNTFVGGGAGQANMVGKLNSIFGYQAGANSAGDQNAFFGQGTGFGSQGNFNAFFGQAAGNNAGSGSENVAMGWFAGSVQGTGGGNTFIGSQSGFTTPVPTDQAGSSNTTIGRLATVSPGLFTATAVGAFATATQSSSLILGSTGIRVGIGNTAPQSKLHITDATGNVYMGTACSAGFAGIAFGASSITCANYSLLGGDGNTYINRPSGFSIFFRSANNTQVVINPSGTLSLPIVGVGGTATMCRNAANEIGFCSSSLRYKRDLKPFHAGMALVNRLRPVTFNWKASGAADVGLGAEEVAKVEPRLVTYNDQGEVEGVKYDHLSVVFINAFKEQQAQIDAQRRAIAAQQERIDGQEREIAALRRLIEERLTNH